MGDISIIIRNAATGSTVEVELPDDVQMRDLLPVLAEKLLISDACNLRLSNKTQNFGYNDSDTLVGRKTNPKDVCLLSHEVIQGGIPDGIHTNSIPKVDFEQIRKDKGSLSILLNRYLELEQLCDRQREEINLYRNQNFTNKISTILLVIAQIIIGFGITLLAGSLKGGWIVSSAGTVIFVGGIFFSFWSGSNRKNSDKK